MIPPRLWDPQFLKLPSGSTSLISLLTRVLYMLYTVTILIDSNTSSLLDHHQMDRAPRRSRSASPLYHSFIPATSSFRKAYETVQTSTHVHRCFVCKRSQTSSTQPHAKCLPTSTPNFALIIKPSVLITRRLEILLPLLLHLFVLLVILVILVIHNSRCTRAAIIRSLDTLAFPCQDGLDMREKLDQGVELLDWE